MHDHHAVGHGQRFFLIMRHKDRGDAERLLDGAHFLAQRNADFRVKRRQRLVQQQHAGPHGKRARKRHALLLTAGELERIAGAKFRQPD